MTGLKYPHEVEHPALADQALRDDTDPADRQPSGVTGRARMEVWQGDITRCSVDAIVNAANSSLLGGGGVDGAIHRAGGPEILAACRTLRAIHLGGELPVGQAVATTAGRLDAKWVIHTVGPVYSQTEDRSGMLASAYRECLRVADELGATSIAFPTISAGVYGWPMDSATRIAVETLRTTPTLVDRIILVGFTGAAIAGYRTALDATA